MRQDFQAAWNSATILSNNTDVFSRKPIDSPVVFNCDRFQPEAAVNEILLDDDISVINGRRHTESLVKIGRV